MSPGIPENMFMDTTVTAACQEQFLLVIRQKLRVWSLRNNNRTGHDQPCAAVHLQAIIKPQYVDHIPKAVRGNVSEVLDSKDQRSIKPYLLEQLDLAQVRGLHLLQQCMFLPNSCISVLYGISGNEC
jgi:hypothetical protein